MVFQGARKLQFSAITRLINGLIEVVRRGKWSVVVEEEKLNYIRTRQKDNRILFWGLTLGIVLCG